MRDTLTYDDMIKSYEDGYITYEECLSLLEYVDDKYAFETSKETKAKRDDQYYMASDNEWKHDFRQQDQKNEAPKDPHSGRRSMPDPKSIRKIDADDYYAYPKEEYDNYSYLPKSDGTNKKIRKLREKFIDHNTEIKNSDKYDRRITTYAHYSKFNADGTKKDWELHAGRGRKPYHTPIDNDPPDTAMIHYRKKGLKPKTDANTDSEKQTKDALATLLANREFANNVNPTKQHMKYASNKLVYASKSKPSK